VLNLLFNAADATQNEGGIIKVVTENHPPQNGDKKHCVTIRISDNGIGIPKENLKRVFDPFFTTKAAGSGVGLGLSLCQRIIMANGGIDQSNVADPAGGERALLLPIDPDASAERLRLALAQRHGREIAVIINDSFGRPWRLGTVGVALGCAGLPALLDMRGTPDLFGRTLRVTVVGYADEIAAAASLLMGQGREGRPVVIVRGLEVRGASVPAGAIVRPPGEDLFK